MDKWVKLITSDNTIVLTDIEGFMYLDFSEEDVQLTSTTQEIKGVDGLLVGSNKFAPFKLNLNFVYSGVDVHDYHLFKTKLRNIIYQRDPYYVVHSDMPGKKYAVLPVSTSIEDKFGRNGTFTIAFSVYKGYSESLYDTDKFSLSNGKWQFENGLVVDDSIKYNHTASGFRIFNGSNDTINPIMRHKLNIYLNVDAPKGFKLTNNTTGDVFEYTKPIKSSQTLLLKGVHPILNSKRVGIDTNFNFLTLAPGYNDIEITGSGLGKTNSKWVFPFIYR